VRRHVVTAEKSGAEEQKKIFGMEAYVVAGLNSEFRMIRRLGSGSFATVWLARRGDAVVAIKIFLSPSSWWHAQAEAHALRQVGDSRYVVRLLEGPVCLSLHQNGTVSRAAYLLLDYYQSTLLRIHLTGCRVPAVRELMRRILLGVRDMHASGLVHADLKPSNILVDRQALNAVVADLGLSREDREGQPERKLVGSLHYAAPEHLLGAKLTKASDLWNVGCIFAELLTGRLLCGSLQTVADPRRPTNRVEQLFCIFQLFGTPGAWASALPHFSSHFPKWSARTLKCEALGPDGMDLLGKMLQLDPAERITAPAALEHDFFRNDS
jgi:serine/threonine protein kinase